MYVEEGGRSPGGCEQPGPYPSVMAINLLLWSIRDKLDYLQDFIFTVPDPVPSEVTRSWNQDASCFKTIATKSLNQEPGRNRKLLLYFRN